MVRFVIYPTVIECGLKNLFLAFENFLFAIANDLIVYLATGAFLNSFADFTQITATGVAMAQAWIDLYTCACYDLSEVLLTLPIILNPLLVLPPTQALIIPVIPFSDQWTFPETWCAIGGFFNTAMALIQDGFRLTIQILNLIFNPPPPGTLFFKILSLLHFS